MNQPDESCASLPESVYHESNVSVPDLPDATYGQDVRLMTGFRILHQISKLRFGNKVEFYPNCIVYGTGRFTLGDNVMFYPNQFISLGPETGFIDVGHTSHFAPGCSLYGHGGLTVGPHCNIAANVVLATVQHDPVNRGVPMSQTQESGPIVLEEDIWIGANAVVTSNVKIAKGCIIGAGAVVTRDTEPNGVYLGVPAKRVGDRRQP